MPETIPSTTARRTPEQDRSRALVDDILTATLDLLEEDGVDKMTMTAIAAKAGLSKAAIYRYFPNKSALIGELSKRSRNRWTEFIIELTRTPLEPAELIYQGFHAFLTHLREETGRIQLRAAILADPVHAGPDLEARRTNAKVIAEALHANGLDQTSIEDLKIRALLTQELIDGVIRMLSMADDAEAEVIIDSFCTVCVRHLLGAD